MSCDDCKRPYEKLPYGVTFSYLDEEAELPEVKSRHDPTPDFVNFGWLKLCVDCMKERQKKALFQGEIGTFIGFNHEKVSK